MIYGSEKHPDIIEFEDEDENFAQVATEHNSFYITGVSQNCSLLCFSDYYITLGKRVAFFKTMRTVLRWTRDVGGYTKIFSTMTPRDVMRTEVLCLLKLIGFKNVGKAYINKRTGNHIQWLQGDIDTMLENLKELLK
jgi:hypothetical protein